MDVGVQRSKNSCNKKTQNTNTVQGKTNRQSEEREEKTESQRLVYPVPGSVHTGHNSVRKRPLSKEEVEEEEEAFEDEYPSKITRKFWIRP